MVIKTLSNAHCSKVPAICFKHNFLGPFCELCLADDSPEKKGIGPWSSMAFSLISYWSYEGDWKKKDFYSFWFSFGCQSNFRNYTQQVKVYKLVLWIKFYLMPKVNPPTITPTYLFICFFSSILVLMNKDGLNKLNSKWSQDKLLSFFLKKKKTLSHWMTSIALDVNLRRWGHKADPSCQRTVLKSVCGNRAFFNLWQKWQRGDCIDIESQ